MARYCTIEDLRREGFTKSQVSGARLGRLIDAASAYIELVTERFFEPRIQTLRLDGRGSRELLLGQPIIRVDRLELLADHWTEAPRILDPAHYAVYNRHLTLGLLKPDDRDNPRIAILGGAGAFPDGRQNVRVEGIFGYTDPDGTPTGRTPLLIREVCKRLVVREIPLLSKPGEREDGQKRWRLIQEKTRDQSYTLDRLQATGAMTGDPEIDDVLIQFKRPADVGAA